MNPTSDELQAQLMAEQLTHTMDLLKAEVAAVRAAQESYQRLADNRLDVLDKASADHENRIRAATDGVTRFNTVSSLLSGSSFAASVAALLRSFLGG